MIVSAVEFGSEAVEHSLAQMNACGAHHFSGGALYGKGTGIPVAEDAFEEVLAMQRDGDGVMKATAILQDHYARRLGHFSLTDVGRWRGPGGVFW